MDLEKKHRIQLSLDESLVEWVRDYRYARIRVFGDVDYTLQQVFVDAIELLKKQTEIEITPRPDAVKKNEKIKNANRARRRKQALNNKG